MKEIKLKNGVIILFSLLSFFVRGQVELQNMTPREENDPSDIYKIEFVRDRLNLEKSILDSISKKDYLTRELVHELFLTTRDTIKNNGIKHNLELFLINSPARPKTKEMLIYFMQLERDYPNQPMNKFNPFTKEQQKEWDEKGEPNLTTYAELKEFYVLLNAPMVFEVNGKKVKSQEEILKDDLIDILKKNKNDFKSEKTEDPFKSMEFMDFKTYYKLYYDYAKNEPNRREKLYTRKELTPEQYIKRYELFKVKLPAMKGLLKYKGEIFLKKYPNVMEVYGEDKVLEEIIMKDKNQD